jgi:hypothetical protein
MSRILNVKTRNIRSFIQLYKSVLLKYGYKVESFNNFRDSNTDLNFICPNGHILVSSFADFMRNRRCPCDGGVDSYTQEKLEAIFEEQGCKLLSQYTKQKDKVDFQCDCGNFAQIRVDHFLRGIRCNECAKIKRRNTLYKNGTAPCSRQQKYLHKLYGGELNYPIDKCSLDIAFPSEMIYVEYNGSGHNLQVKFNSISETEFNQIENDRFLFLKIEGYKCIYVCSQKDFLPSDNVLINILNLGKNILSNNNLFYVIFDIDNSKIVTSQYERDYNYGKLRKITKKDI